MDIVWTLSGPLNLYWTNESVVAVVVIVVCRFLSIFSSLKFLYSNKMFDRDFCWLFRGLNEWKKTFTLAFKSHSKWISDLFHCNSTSWLNSTPVMFSWTSKRILDLYFDSPFLHYFVCWQSNRNVSVNSMAFRPF